MAEHHSNQHVRVPFFNTGGVDDPHQANCRHPVGLTEEAYQQCRPIWPNLPVNSEDFIDWLSFADADQIAGLLAETTRYLARRREPNPVLSQFRQVIVDQCGFRSDGDTIKQSAGCQSDPASLTPPNDSNPPPVPTRKSRRRALPAQLKQGPRHPGFSVHVRRERELAARHREAAKSPWHSPKPSDTPAFAESYGAVELFSIREAEEIYTSAEVLYNADNQRYVDRRIREVLKHGNRRQLAKAPSVEQIRDLRARFPNAAEVIDVVDRAAALARLSEFHAFALRPLLIVGDPGIGKTAVVKAIAKSIAAPFDRIDIATLSMGSQLFGTSLSWSTGRTGSIFNVLTISPVLNVVMQLDEIDKASGNAQSPVLPPLLSLLERETSAAFKDEAIPLTLNAQHILWFATANELDDLPAPLRSRFHVVRMHQPVGPHALTVASLIYRSICTENPWGVRFPAEIDRKVARRLGDWTPREMSRLLTDAFGKAALEGRTHLIASDIPLPVTKPERRFGFI